ncbi:MAG: hypothetical protein WC595_01620, partial [Candidatus Nanoarchaeia archaeon]
MKQEKVILTKEEIDTTLKEFKGTPDDILKAQKKFLRGLFLDDDYKKQKKHIVKEYTDRLLKKPVNEYELIYDSLSEGLEPIYYWVLDFMRDSSPGGLGLDVFKGPEQFEASVTSGYFGEIGQRLSLMQQKGGEYLGAINQVIKSILNLLYDLKEFDIRIDLYDKLKNPKEKQGAVYSLKAVWMDTVDTKKGRGSINLLAQDLQFSTLRDAFFYIEDINKIDKLDLNDRVKRLLKIKLEEFDHWMNKSELEVRKRYNVERAYLKSQIGSLKLYAGWAKPYLRAAQKLKMKEFNIPDIVNSFSNIEIDISIVGKKEVKPASIHESYRHVKLDMEYFQVIETTMKFRGVPSAVTIPQGGRQYVHGGRAHIYFKAYAFDKIEWNALSARELYEDIALVDEFVGES